MFDYIFEEQQYGALRPMYIRVEANEKTVLQLRLAELRQSYAYLSLRGRAV
jgi:hypothetical protein